MFSGNSGLVEFGTSSLEVWGGHGVIMAGACTIPLSDPAIGREFVGGFQPILRSLVSI